MYRKNKLIHGVGINDYEGSVGRSGNVIPSYHCWHGMLRRCYDPKSHIKRPTYIGCSVSDEWKYFSNFKKWYDINYIEGFELDKDILVEGNKVYSKETCRFIPPYINTILNDHRSVKRNLPRGVSENKPNEYSKRVNITYKASCQGANSQQLNKTFKTIEEAVTWYSETKTRVVREVATRALEAGEIQPDVFDALIRRQF